MLDPTGTIGSKPCEIVLNRILSELNDTKLISKTIKQFAVVKTNVKKLKKFLLNNDVDFYILMLNILREHTLKSLDSRSTSFPYDVYTHLRCCLVGIFTDAYQVYYDKIKIKKPSGV